LLYYIITNLKSKEASNWTRVNEDHGDMSLARTKKNPAQGWVKF